MVYLLTIWYIRTNKHQAIFPMRNIDDEILNFSFLNENKRCTNLISTHQQWNMEPTFSCNAYLL